MEGDKSFSGIPHGARTPPRDKEGRDARIHGIVLTQDNMTRSLRELLRQWAASGQDGSPELLARTEQVLEWVDVNGEWVDNP